MRGWAGPLFVVLLAFAAPLLAPPAWLASGWMPDLAVLAVVTVAFRGTADRAAFTGVAIGLLVSLRTPEPVAFHPFVLGTTGWLAAQAAQVFDRERTLVRMACAAGAAVLSRVAAHTAAAFACAGGTPWTAADAGRAVAAVLAAGACAALAAPPWFAFVRRFRLVAPLDRSFRDV